MADCRGTGISSVKSMKLTQKRLRTICDQFNSSLILVGFGPYMESTVISSHLSQITACCHLSWVDRREIRAELSGVKIPGLRDTSSPTDLLKVSRWFATATTSILLPMTHPAYWLPLTISYVGAMALAFNESGRQNVKCRSKVPEYRHSRPGPRKPCFFIVYTGIEDKPLTSYPWRRIFRYEHAALRMRKWEELAPYVCRMSRRFIVLQQTFDGQNFMGKCE